MAKYVKKIFFTYLHKNPGPNYECWRNQHSHIKPSQCLWESPTWMWKTIV